MSNVTNPYVRYLNGLHNYYAQNQNAYGEKNVESPYYIRTMVEMDVCEHIIDSLSNKEPHILILTGHAGDGKTSLMYQVLTRLGVEPDFTAQTIEIEYGDAKHCLCIKDFSELSDDNKYELLSKIVDYPSQGKYVFMVANTGPLINTFGKLFKDQLESEKAKMQLIDAMDVNRGELLQISDYPFLVINIAAIDNTSFPTKYLRKIIDDSLWSVCENCQKKSFCHIHMNQQLIKHNVDRVASFLDKYYVWETEYGHRLTIRSMTEQLAYMMTGGVSCENVQPIDIHKLLFFNLFFGYYGTVINTQANSILAIRLAQENHFDNKRLRADEDLIIRKCYDELFSTEVQDLIRETEKTTAFMSGWTEEVRRMYFFLSIVPDEIFRRDTEDIFSKQYTAFLDLRNGNSKHTKRQKELIVDALRMMYLGTVVSNSNSIPVTLSKESGIAQSVQLVVGEINKGEIEVITKADSKLNQQKHNILLRINKSKEILLSLPMIDYFEELRSGVISTNIDPQLSHGIESLKAQILNAAHFENDDLEMIIMNNNGYEKMSVTIEDDTLRIN